jgi:hypothetical protein
MPSRKKSAKARTAHWKKPIFMPKNDNENRISSAGDTQKLISNFPCPKNTKIIKPVEPEEL